MVVLPLSQGVNESGGAPPNEGAQCANWIRFAAAGTLAASGALLITGNRRAGLVAAASGVALAMLDQQDTVCAWWDALPGFLEELQGLLSRTQAAVEDLSTQSQKLRRALGR
ncbi:MAG: hypothetical protein ABSG10_09415 [Terracidiphilus sp.]|jgi:hypothetical protein